MRTVVILPVKRFQQAKQRLGEGLGGGARAAFAQTMYRDVVSALKHCHEADEVVVVSGDREARDLALDNGFQVLEDTTDDSHNKAVIPALDQCIRSGFDQALLLAADCPMMKGEEIDHFLRDVSGRELDVAVIPDRHGVGTNGLLLRPPTVMEPSFGNDSLARHTQKAEEKGLNFEVQAIPSLELDIDSESDLEELKKRLEDDHGSSPLTRGAIMQMERTRQSEPVAT